MRPASCGQAPARPARSPERHLNALKPRACGLRISWRQPGTGAGMTRKVLVLALAIPAASAVATGAFARHTMVPTLAGTDGPGYKIPLQRSRTAGKTLK